MAGYIMFEIIHGEGSPSGKPGTMVVSNASNEGVFDPDEGKGIDMFPKNTYSIRWFNPCSWGWYKGGQLVETLPNSDSASIKTFWDEVKNDITPLGDSNYTYSGGLLAGPNVLPQYSFPITEDGKMPPDGQADTLIIQVYFETDIQYLSKDQSPLVVDEAPEPPEWPDPPSNDLCEITPIACEPYEYAQSRKNWKYTSPAGLI
jgi:hypothetical protein